MRFAHKFKRITRKGRRPGRGGRRRFKSRKGSRSTRIRSFR